YNLKDAANTRENQLLKNILDGETSLSNYIGNDPYDISPVRDDSPYFYKVKRGIPGDYFRLFIGVVLFTLIVILIPYSLIKKKIKRNDLKALSVPLLIFICIGAGFMIVEVSLFQKLILYLGSPTISLSILLSSLLVGMGIGSFYGGKIYPGNNWKRLLIVGSLIVVIGILFSILHPLILGRILKYNLFYRTGTSFLMILPFGFLLGIPFPTTLQILKNENSSHLIPWMYGVNGAASVLGSVLAVILSMLYGFTYSFFIGLFFYTVIFIAAWLASKK
ncbi:MAG TPA: hypothetical protein VMT35_15795, partial [Ignavibacteriaceae bacterium]|nr:hypothetical protein [Ignavibacteriaceae bacterium]